MANFVNFSSTNLFLSSNHETCKIENTCDVVNAACIECNDSGDW